MSAVLEVLINASERAATVARACGSSESTLLVTEKNGGDANIRFEKDFKTVADVLAQESARAEISARCPGLGDYLRGEECAEIGGIRVGLSSTIDETTKNLTNLVPPATAREMAEAAHCRPLIMLPESLQLPNIDPAQLGVWIDPIDGTSEFIAGVTGAAAPGHGLPCVTVLVGAYLRSTGEPVIGVINQPFYNDGKGRILWGLVYGEAKEWGGIEIDNVTSSHTLLVSAAENPDIVKKFEDAGWEINFVPGAGHKLLKVALGEAAGYIISKDTTYRWDTCAPHAILRAKGGNLISFDSRQPLTYNDPMDADTQEYCNTGGIIAYSSDKVLQDIVSILD